MSNLLLGCVQTSWRKTFSAIRLNMVNEVVMYIELMHMDQAVKYIWLWHFALWDLIVK